MCSATGWDNEPILLTAMYLLTVSIAAVLMVTDGPTLWEKKRRKMEIVKMDLDQLKSREATDREASKTVIGISRWMATK